MDFKCVYETEVTVSDVDITLSQPLVNGGVGTALSGFAPADQNGNQAGVYDKQLFAGSFEGGFRLNFFTDKAPVDIFRRISLNR